MSNDITTKDAIVLERTMDATPELVWNLWTDPEHFKAWYGPKGFRVAFVEMDVRVGGRQLVCMEGQTPNGMMSIWTTGEYTEVAPHERLVHTNSPSNEAGEIVPISIDGNMLPLVTTVSILLEDLGGRTKMTMIHAGLPEGEEGAAEGWNQAMEKFADYLGTIDA